MDIKLLEEIVESINIDLYNLTEIEYFYLTVVSHGFSQQILFLDLCLWDSEMEDRNTNEYGYYTETIEDYVRRRLVEELEKLNALFFALIKMNIKPYLPVSGLENYVKE